MAGRRKRMKTEDGHLPVAVPVPIPPKRGGGQVGGPRRKEVFKLAAKVFGNDLLREIIVNHAIHRKFGYLDKGTAYSLRSVGKDWNDSVCKMLHKNGDPLFAITASKQIYCNNVTRSDNSHKLLDKFTTTFSCSSRILDRTPTCQLILYEDAFQPNYSKSLHKFLRDCRQCTVQLRATIPPSPDSLKGIFQNVSLPSLQKAKIIFVRSDRQGGILQSDSVTNFLQSIFSGATALKELEMEYKMRNLYQPSVFEGIVLPPSLERIKLLEGFDRFSSVDLDMILVKNKLTNLSSLVFSASDYEMPIGLLSRIFENLRCSLKNLVIDRTMASLTDPPTINLFRFPIMEKLETFEFYSECCQLEPGISSLEAYLPKLRVLKFLRQTPVKLEKWTKGSRYSSVQELHLISWYVSLDLDVELMSRIHLAFPNVRVRNSVKNISSQGLGK